VGVEKGRTEREALRGGKTRKLGSEGPGLNRHGMEDETGEGLLVREHPSFLLFLRLLDKLKIDCIHEVFAFGVLTTELDY